MAATPPGASTVPGLEASIGLVEVFRGFEDEVAGKNLAGRVHRQDALISAPQARGAEGRCTA